MYSKFEKLMLEKGLSANRIAKEAGINAPSLTYWKQGKYTPSLKTLQKLAEYFGVSVDYFLNEVAYQNH